ncbi:hypothetical protein JCM10914A_30620 [Paenibacillus sp. JCM 10914]|uniref:DUF6773 family protein n=1 Tax=Paenibacillus sp. JCM 10914 TaxID=1236974 RepID=UPI0003CC863B|nr:DUF6773 family protein [Paenibacillus sp. JCM 10914]GAE07201.1 hypothetical protein JCM10914_3414 [Paenibacillus sp. JCM 10914]
MKWFKKHSAEDERIVNLKNKIYKEVYILIMIICSISVIIKSFALHPTESVWLELLIMLSGSIYFGIRSVALGIYSDEVEVHDQRNKMSFSKRTALWGLAIGIILALYFGIRSAVLFGNDNSSTEIKYFFMVFFVSLILYIPLFVGVNLVIHHGANRVSQKMSQNDQLDS